MNNTAIFLPMLSQISLTLLMFILLGIRKSAALKTKKIDRQKTALDSGAWNKEVVQVSNNIANQFQTPVLFYLLCMILFATNQLSDLILLLAWSFVITRVIHAFVHVTSNTIAWRLGSFSIGVLILLAMTVIAFIHIV